MAAQLPSLPKSGDLIGGRFRIQDKLGSGGFGTVYRAIQENIGREVALKFLSPKIARDPVNIERFRREAYHVSQLRHPNTITLYDYGQTEDGLFYMVMEVLEGIALSDAIQKEGAMEEGRAAHVFLQILRSLTEAHQRGIVHRDMKPENVHLCEMFGEQDYVKVLDFGVAKMTMMDGQSNEDQLTRSGRIFGTPMYMSPEQACAEPITLATDIYSLGLLIFEMFTGLPPVTGRNRMDVIHKQIRDEVPRLTKKLKGTPLGDVIRKATKKKPEERYANAMEMHEAFYAAVREMGIFPAPRGSTRPEISVLGPGDRATPAPMPAYTTVPSDLLESLPPTSPDIPSSPPPLPPDAVKKPALPVASAGVHELIGDDEEEPTQISAPHPDVLALESGEITFEEVQLQELPLIGRERDIERISDLIAQSINASSGHFVLLEGEGGVGKTRVVRELRQHLLAQHIGLSIGTFQRRGVALDTLREALADYWWVRDADRETVDTVIRADLSALGVKRDDIDFLVNFVRPDHTSRSYETTKETRELFAQLERTLLLLGELRPFVLVLEDVQQADSATLSFLEYFSVTLRTQPAPIVIMLTLRSGERSLNPDLEQSLRTMSGNIGAGFSRIRLRRLRGRELSVLLDAILPIEARLKERVAWLSQGNPLHAIQIVRYMEVEATLAQENGRWRLKSGTPREIDLPPDLMDMMALRLRKSIQANDPSMKLEQTANWLAILGIRVPTQLIAQVVARTEGLDDAALARNIAILRRFGVVHERTHRQLQCLEFDNSLVREAILGQLASRPEHAAMHRQAAAQKVAFYERIKQSAPMLEIAEHWRLAGDDERYRDALFAAAERSLHQGDPRGARDQFRELLLLLEQRHEHNDQWAAAQLALADLARRFGEFGQAEDTYRQVLESKLLSGAERARAARGVAHLLFNMGRYPEAIDYYTLALKTSTDGDDTPGVIKALIGLSRSYLRQGEPAEGQRVRERLESMLGTLPTGALSGRVLLHLAEAAKRMGQVHERTDYLNRALNQYQQSRDKQGLANAQVYLAGMLMEPAENWPERMAEASRLLRQAREIRRALGDRQGVAEVFRYLGHLEQELGDLEASENYLYQSLRMLEALGAPFDLGAVHNSLAVTKMWMGRYDETLKHFDEAERLFASIGDQLAVSHVHLNKGVAEINRLNWERAATMLERTRTSKEAFDSTWGLFDLYNHLALIELKRGDFAHAMELVSLTLNGGAPDEERVAARSMLGLVQCFQSRLQVAALELERARADAEDINNAKVSAFCQANACFYAALTGSTSAYDALIKSVRETRQLNALTHSAWLEMLEGATLAVAEHDPTASQTPRLLHAVSQLWESFEQPERAQRLIARAGTLRKP